MDNAFRTLGAVGVVVATAIVTSPRILQGGTPPSYKLGYNPH